MFLFLNNDEHASPKCGRSIHKQVPGPNSPSHKIDESLGRPHPVKKQARRAPPTLAAGDRPVVLGNYLSSANAMRGLPGVTPHPRMPRCAMISPFC